MVKDQPLSRREAFRVGLAAATMLTTPAVVRAQTKSMPVTIVNTGGPLALTFGALLKQQGFLDQFGIDATFINVSDTSKIMSGLLGGNADICMFAGFGPVLPAIEKGAKMKVLAGASLLAPLSIFTAKPEIKTLKNLEGKIIGTGSLGAVLHQVMVAALQKNGVDPAKITFVNVGTTADILKAVIVGTIDAGPCNVDAYSVAEKNKLHSIGDLWKLLPEYPYQGSFSTDGTILAKREILVRTLAAHARLYRFISAPNSRDAYVAAYVSGTNGDPAQGAAAWQFIQEVKPYAVNLTIPDESMTFMQKLNQQTGVQQKIVPNTEVANMSLAADALKLL